MTRDDDGVLDLCRPCGYCKACCDGTYRLWYAAQGRRRSAEIDQPTLDQVFADAYAEDAPAIVHAWNESFGWSDAPEPEGATIDAGELLALLEASPEYADDDRLARLAAFVRAAREAGAALHILDD